VGSEPAANAREHARNAWLGRAASGPRAWWPQVLRREISLTIAVARAMAPGAGSGNVHRAHAQLQGSRTVWIQALRWLLLERQLPRCRERADCRLRGQHGVLVALAVAELRQFPGERDH